MPPQWIARLCDFLDVLSQNAVKRCQKCYQPPSYHLFVRKPPCWTHLPSDLVLSNTAASVQSCWAYRGDNGVPWRSVAKYASGFLFVCHFAVKVWKHWVDRNTVFNTYSWITMNISWELPGWDQFKLSWCKGATPALPHAAGQLELQTSCLTHVSDLGIALRLPMLCSFINQQPPFLDAFPIIFLSPFGYTIEWGCCRWLELPHLHWAVLKFYMSIRAIWTPPNLEGKEINVRAFEYHFELEYLDSSAVQRILSKEFR